MTKKYLVTGAAGFIGANFVKYLLGQYGSDVEIVILDALTYAGNLMTIKDEIELPNVRFVKGDIGDRALVDYILREFDPDYIVNFAAESHVDRSITNPRLFLETNILGTQTLLDAARDFWGKEPGDRKYLQISTDEVYGALELGDEARDEAIDEDIRDVAPGRDTIRVYGPGMFTEQTPMSPHSPYSASKASADMLVMAYHDTYGLPVNITRCSNNYGPYHFPEKFIPLLINNIRNGRELPVYGKGVNVRDWLYVEDHARAIDAVLRRGRVGEIYNIGGFNEMQNIDIVHLVIDLVAEMTGTEPRTDLIRYVTDRPGHDMRYAIDPHKIAKELGWTPATKFADGIRKTIRWYIDNPEWVESVTSGDYQKYYQQMYADR